MKSKNDTAELFQHKNQNNLSIIFISCVVFTALGFAVDIPREIRVKEYALVTSNVCFFVISISLTLLYILRKIKRPTAFTFVALAQIVASIISVSYQLHHNTLEEHEYTVELMVQLIYIAIIGFLIKPRFVFYYASFALLEHTLLFVFREKTLHFDFIYIYTCTIIGFAIAMYFFSRGNVRNYIRVCTLAEEAKIKNNEIERLNNFKTDLVSMVVHDIKSPLNLIISKTDLHEVKDAAVRINNMVQNILDIEKYKNTSLELNQTSFSINISIEKVIRQMDYAIHNKNIEIKYTPKHNYNTMADQVIIERVLENLFSNAVRFTAPNKCISVEISPYNDDKLKLGIVNDGQSIPEDKLQDIFHKFSQIDTATNGSNSGLGLTFCQLAITNHKEDIWAKNIGSDRVGFYITLPNVSASKLLSDQRKKILSISLNKEEKAKISSVCHIISELKIHDASQIIEALKQVPKPKSSAIMNWEKQVKKAIYSSNAELLQQLIHTQRA